ncbi:MAG: hypothetical protein K6F68_05340 [Clostridiales bacterium]|nr:hypothetical protein [Clostridiales bacterium]
MEQFNDRQETWKKELRALYCKVLCGLDSPNDHERGEYIYRNLAPQLIYKYCPVSDYSIANLADDTMWYDSPANFNDVFDVDFPVNKDRVLTDMLAHLQETADLSKDRPEWETAGTNAKSLLNAFCDSLHILRLRKGISCFSESDSSLLMWAHYAQHHK